MNTPRKNAPVLAADIPAAPDTGCVLIAGGFLTWLCVAGFILLFITALNFGKVMSSIHRTLYFPHVWQSMEQKHTVEERQAFSNAFMQCADELYYHGLTRSNAWTLTVMNTIGFATQDKVVTRSESSNFVASVEAHSTINELPDYK